MLVDENEVVEDETKTTPAQSENDNAEEKTESIDDEITVSIGDESPKTEDENKAPTWVRELRKSHREAQKELKELRAKLATKEGASELVLRKKPTLEHHDYDVDKFEADYDKWLKEKAEHDNAAKASEEKKTKDQQSWNEQLETYAEEKKALKVRDYDDAESLVEEKLSQTQQGIIISGAKSKALLIYALGKNPDKLDELSKIKDPVKFAFAVSKLEDQLKVNKRSAPAQPDKPVVGKGAQFNTGDATLDRLRQEADKTGDYTKVIRYKQTLKNKK